MKSLIQFRSVAKPWKSLIDSSEFITDYHTRHHNHRLLVRYIDSAECINKYVSVVDDDNFPQQKDPMTVNFITNHPELVSMTTSQGLLCLYNTYRSIDYSGTTTAVLWNPTIRKSLDISVPNFLYSHRYKTVIGFGVSPRTNDPVLVKITYINKVNSGTISCIPWHVEVFTLSTGVWRSLCTNVPHKFIQFSWDHVAIDRFIYWICIDWCDVDGSHKLFYMIMSFDMESEVFTKIPLSDCLTRFCGHDLKISKLKESLVVIEIVKRAEIKEYVVWIMEHGVANSFRKLFTIRASDAPIGSLFGFRKSGEHFHWSFSFDERSVISVYDPRSQRFDDIVISENARVYSVSSYAETLLLLDH